MRTLTTMILMLAVGVAGAQPTAPSSPKAVPKKSALEDALDQALKNNPDLRVAASKLALAEAELSRTRLQITQKVAAAYADVEVGRATVKQSELELARVGQLRKNGVISSGEVAKYELQLVEAKAKLAAAERELTHLQGKGERATRIILDNPGGNIRLWTAPDGATVLLGDKRYRIVPMQRGTLSLDALSVTTGGAKIAGCVDLRRVLQKPVTLSGQKLPLSEFLALVKKTAGVGIQADAKDPAWKETVDFDLKDVTVGGMLQFLEDSLPNHRIVVRPYGLLIATREKVPEGAVTLTRFLNAGGDKAEQEKKAGGQKESKLREPHYFFPESPDGEKPAAPAGDAIEGKIVEANDKGGKNLCRISIGSDAGLTKETMLEVYRPAPTPKYIGRIKVIEVQSKWAVGQSTGRMAGNLMVGDVVTTRITPRDKTPVGK